MAANQDGGRVGNINPALLNIQPVDTVTPPVTPPKIYYKGEYTLLDDSLDFEVDQGKLANYNMVIGTDRSIYGLLKQHAKLLPNGPYVMDSRDGGILIHNRNFNQPCKYVYTYHGGNHELISCYIRTEKQKKSVQATESSTIDPLTKDVTTTVTQICGDPVQDSADMTTQYNFGAVGTDDFRTSLLDQMYKNLSLKGSQQTEEQELKRRIIESAKDEKSTKEDLMRTYEVTENDIREYMGELKTTFTSLMDNAKTSGDFMPLLKANSMKKVVKVKRNVKVRVNPIDYGGNNESNIQVKYKAGMNYLKSTPGIIFIGYSDTSQITDGSTVGYNTFPDVDVIMEKEIELELDGSRVFASPLAQNLQDIVANTDVTDKTIMSLKSSIEVIGRPGLTSSIMIRLNNISNRYSGEWYVTKVRHKITAGGGYMCSAELIKKGLPIVVNNTKSTVSTRGLYASIHDVAVDSNGKPILTTSEIRNILSKFKEEHPEYTNASLVLDLTSHNPDGTYNIYPADEDMVDINKEREKYRR